MQINRATLNPKIAIIGQGYVGLPLAVEFAKYFPVVGFDINTIRVHELRQGIDSTREIDPLQLENVLLNNNPFLSETTKVSTSSDEIGLLREKETIIALFDIENQDGFDLNDSVNGLFVTADSKNIRDANVYIVTVPTPIDRYNAPNLQPLIRATKDIAKLLTRGDIVIYESTVYPGCTEEDCVPLLENISGLRFNIDFFVGYSPERINPGDKINTLTNVKKITSGSTAEASDFIDGLYQKIIVAGTYKAPSIRVAEAAKAVENAQRDINISFVNELALIFDRMGIDTQDVLDAASTKYNFLSFKPGLVGGHCISVDPFYLAHKATELGYLPNVILSGRRVNDQMGHFVASKVVKLLSGKNFNVKGSTVLILGVTFKENCTDIRNTKVLDIYSELMDYGVEVDIYDPWASKDEVYEQYNVRLLETSPFDSSVDNVRVVAGKKYDAIILAVAHREFLNVEINRIRNENSVVFDTKGVWPREWVDARL